MNRFTNTLTTRFCSFSIIIANCFFFTSYPESSPPQCGQAPHSSNRILSHSMSVVKTRSESSGGTRRFFKIASPVQGKCGSPHTGTPFHVPLVWSYFPWMLINPLLFTNFCRNFKILIWYFGQYSGNNQIQLIKWLLKPVLINRFLSECR